MPSTPTQRAANAAAGIASDQRIRLTGKHTPDYYPETLRRIHLIVPETGKPLVLLTNHFSLPATTIAALYKARWQVSTLAGRVVLQMDQAAPAYQEVLRYLRERGEDANLDRGVGVRTHRDHQKTLETGAHAVRLATGALADALRENYIARGSPRGYTRQK